jgi:hypothetical protein
MYLLFVASFEQHKANHEHRDLTGKKKIVNQKQTNKKNQQTRQRSMKTRNNWYVRKRDGKPRIP